MKQRIEKNTFFGLYLKRHEDLYKTMHLQLTGALSVMFTRLVIVGETKMQPHEIPDPEICQKVLGLDANSPYLQAIVQGNPTGYFCRCKEEEHYRPDPYSKFGLQTYQWLSFVAHTKEMFIQSRYNMRKRRVSSHSLPVDD